jgi:hypothetical protein
MNAAKSAEKACATLLPMASTHFYFAYFSFSRFTGGREV